MLVAVALALAYAVGSVLFGPLVARSRGVDLYAVGSGNPGATNVERALGRGPALVVLGLDGAKGLFATLLARLLCDGDEGAIASAGAVAVLGHCFPLTLSLIHI
ncbi:MAG: glycerol-3-phosphate acyltransferase [Candidatus Eisenbacteria bacterium]|nr:glycerol-3-phosphate acyltransferase [Candidatus Eisenbacteria bacterium]